MRGMREPSQKLHNAMYFMCGVMTVILVLVIVVGVQTKAQNAGKQKDYQPQASAENQTPEADAPQQESSQPLEKWQEGIVTYKGKNYQYNSSIRSYLMMGIDKNDPVTDSSDYTDGGQSDAMFLLVADTETQKLTVISINRNTMVDISLCDADGIDLGELNTQICLQHAFGDGKRLSCSRSVDVVAKLFGNIPVSGYLAMNMGAIPQMNDAIGGVEVTVLQDLSFPEADITLKEGETVVLSGEEAYYYLHGRDVAEYDSATDRLRREEQYMIAYMDKLKTATVGKSAIAVDIYNSIADYLVTSVDFTSLITELAEYDFSEEQMYTVPGETVMGDPIDGQSYEEYHVDEEALQELIMQVFYEPVEDSGQNVSD